MLTHPRLFSHHLCSERVSVPTSMVSYYHQVFSLTLSHTLSQPCHPTHTPMVSSYHQVYSLTALRELVLPLTLPWCRTTTKSSHSHSLTHSLSHSCHPCEHSHGVVLPPSLPTHCSERTCAPTHTSMVSYYHQVYPLTVFSHSHTLSHPCHPCEHFHGVVLPPSHHTPTPILVLPLTPIYHVLTHSAPLTSFHLILTTNSSQLISHTLPPIMPPSHHHHLITSSYHQPQPIASSHSTQHS